MRILSTVFLAALVVCGLTAPARADYFFWRDAKTGLSLSYPDTWRLVSGHEPNDIATLMAPSGRAHAMCRVRVNTDRRFMVYPPRFAPQIQHIHLGADYWDAYLKAYDDDQPYKLLDNAGLGRGFAGFAEAVYTSAVPGPEMPRKGVIFSTIYFGKMYVLDCSSHRDAFETWKYPFLGIANSIDFKPAYHQLTTGNYRNFMEDPRIDFQDKKERVFDTY